MYDTNSYIKFKTSILKASLCDYIDAYILANGTITAATFAAATEPGNNNKKVIFNFFSLFTDCMSEIYNTQIDNAKNIDVVMPMYNLIKYNDNSLKTSQSLW